MALLAVGHCTVAPPSSQGTSTGVHKASNMLHSMAPGTQDPSSAKSPSPPAPKAGSLNRITQTGLAAGHAASGALERMGDEVVELHTDQRAKPASPKCRRIFKHLDRAVEAKNLV